MKNCWRLKTLEEIADIYNGNSINTKEKNDKYTGLEFGTPYIATKDVSFDNQINYDNGILIPEPKCSEFRIAPKNSVLVCAEGGSAGRKVAHNDRDINFGNKLYAIVPSADLNSKYLFYFCISRNFYDAFSEIVTGIIGGVSLNKFKKLLIPLPPLPEQKSVVAILDEAFEGIDKAIANTEKNLANARELFESYLNSMVIGGGKGFVEMNLTDLLERQPRNGWSPAAKYHSDEGTPVLTLSSVTGFEFDFSKIKHTSADTKHDAHYWIQNGDLLITRSNTHELVGHVAIVNGIEKPTIYPDLIMKMKVKNDIALTKFIYYQLRSAKLRELISNSAQGANPTMKKINKPIVQSLPIVMTSLEKQKYIIQELDSILEQTKHLESIYKQKLTACSELKQSLLQKAFAGDLTTEDRSIKKEAVA